MPTGKLSMPLLLALYLSPHTPSILNPFGMKKAHTYVDLDGDSEMASSPESEHDSQLGSRTPTDKARGSRFVGSELSPPGSQTRQAPEPLGLRFDKGTTKKDAVKEADKPGASWMNKRSEEEYQRAMEYVVDKDFSLRMCRLYSYTLPPLL